MREELRLPTSKTPDAAAPAELERPAPATARVADKPAVRKHTKKPEVHSDDIKIEQPAPIVDHRDYDGDIILVDRPLNKNVLEALAFMEEPVTIRLEPTAEKNAPTWFPVWVNGKGAELFQRGQWQEIAYLPVGRVITIKRKVLEVIIRAKLDSVATDVREPESEHPNNVIKRFTSAVHSFSVIEDANPRGVAWMTEMRRRNF